MGRRSDQSSLLSKGGLFLFVRCSLQIRAVNPYASTALVLTSHPSRLSVELQQQQTVLLGCSYTSTLAALMNGWMDGFRKQAEGIHPFPSIIMRVGLRKSSVISLFSPSRPGRGWFCRPTGSRDPEGPDLRCRWGLSSANVQSWLRRLSCTWQSWVLTRWHAPKVQNAMISVLVDGNTAKLRLADLSFFPPHRFELDR